MSQDTNLSLFDEFLNKTNNGSDLLKKHNLFKSGTWQIFSEDPNCDYHHRISLGFVEGKLADIVEYAVNLPGFWGVGDSIEEVIVTKITPDTNHRTELTKKKQQLQQQFNNIKAELGEIK